MIQITSSTWRYSIMPAVGQADEQSGLHGERTRSTHLKQTGVRFDIIKSVPLAEIWCPEPENRMFGI